MKQFKIGIDCRFWGIEHAGLGRYTRELTLSMLAQESRINPGVTPGQESRIEFTLFFQKGSWREDKERIENCKIVEVEIPHYSVQEQLLLGRIFDQEGLDLLHVPHFNVPFLLKTPFVVTIHDLIKHFFKGRSVTTRALPLYWLKHWAYRGVIRRAVTQSRHILVPSYFAQDQILAHYPVKNEKITVTYEGVAEIYQRSKIKDQKVKQILEKYRLKKPFFVYTGSAYPFKDLPTLLEALRQLHQDGQKAHLLIACARSVFWERLRQEIAQLSLTQAVRLPGQVPDEDLHGLYQEAAAFVIPSLMEGFGLPGLEALASGCPVIAARAGSLEEVYGQAALYFPPQDDIGLAEMMRQVLGMDKKERQERINQGKKQAQKYSWEKTAKETMEVYKRALES